MVINAVTLETAGEIASVIKELNLVEEEIISVSVDRTRKVGRYHLMDAQNPVYIAVVRGR
jgi:precorrin-6Y C5,15-methyltransferase (decarboxylating)